MRTRAVHKLIPAAHQLAADAAAAVSVAAAGYTWLQTANEALQAVATLVAIAAGLAAARFHITKTRLLKQQQKEQS